MALTLSGTSGVAASGAITSGGLNVPTATFMTEQTTTSGTFKDFTVPSTARLIYVLFNAFSTNGSSNPIIRLGTSGGIETTGYDAVGTFAASGGGSGGSNYTVGFGFSSGSAGNVLSGQVLLSSYSSNGWSASGSLGTGTSGALFNVCGNKTLAGALTTVRITTVNGTDSFDAGSVNVIYMIF